MLITTVQINVMKNIFCLNVVTFYYAFWLTRFPPLTITIALWCITERLKLCNKYIFSYTVDGFIVVMQSRSADWIAYDKSFSLYLNTQDNKLNKLTKRWDHHQSDAIGLKLNCLHSNKLVKCLSSLLSYFMKPVFPTVGDYQVGDTSVGQIITDTWTQVIWQNILGIFLRHT